MKVFLKIVCFLLISIGIIFTSITVIEKEPQNTEKITLKTQYPRRGNKQDIPEEIKRVMNGISMPEGATVRYDDLSYLTIYHYDFEGKVTTGHMVVDKTLADEVLDIFAELYDLKYRIERMDLIDYYNDLQTDILDSLDNASMGYNNTSSFCYRTISGTSTMSYHAYGRAIDVNPKINPYVVVKSGRVSPRNAYQYRTRENIFSDVENRALIRHGDPVYNVFKKYGWDWGGDWKNVKDYQHFEKKF